MTRDKPDANKAALVKLWRSAGGLWIDQRREAGFDGLALFRGRVWLVEIKDGRLPPSGQALTPNEQRQQAAVELRGVAYTIWRSVEDVCATLEIGA